MKFVAKHLAIFNLSYMEHVKVFNPFSLKKLNEYVIWKKKTSLFGYHGPPFLIRYLNVLCIPCQELVRLTCGTRPRNSVLTVTCPVVERSQLRSNGHKRMHTGYLQDAERTRTGQTAYQRKSNVHPPDIFIRWRPSEVLNVSKLANG